VKPILEIRYDAGNLICLGGDFKLSMRDQSTPIRAGGFQRTHKTKTVWSKLTAVAASGRTQDVERIGEYDMKHPDKTTAVRMRFPLSGPGHNEVSAETQYPRHFCTTHTK
jgi:hypothetical protein